MASYNNTTTNKREPEKKNVEMTEQTSSLRGPEFQGIFGPLVPMKECKTFNQRFPCMTPNLLTGNFSKKIFSPTENSGISEIS